MKGKSYQDIEDFLDGEKTSLRKEEVKGDKRFRETLELFTVLKRLPEVPAPPDLEKNLYKSIGISYVPVYRKVLTLAGLSIFSALVYLTGLVSLRFVTSKITVTTVSQFFTQVYTKFAQVISLIKVGEHLKDIFLAFTNPLLFLVLAFVSSILMLILVGLSREVKKGKVILIRF